MLERSIKIDGFGYLFFKCNKSNKNLGIINIGLLEFYHNFGNKEIKKKN